MRSFTTPELCELNITQTAMNIEGYYQDGTYVGDSAAGHLTYDEGEASANPTNLS